MGNQKCPLAPANGTLQIDTPKSAPSNGLELQDEFRDRYPHWFAEPTPEQVEQDAKAERGRLAKLQQLQGAAGRPALADFLKRVGKRYADCTLENFICTDAKQRGVLSALKQYAENLPGEVQAGHGIILFGGAGSGKDHLVVALGRIAIAKHNIDVRWTNGSDMFGMFRDAMDSQDSHTSERSIVARFTTPAVLIVSDPCPPRGTLSEYQASTLLRILDARYRELRPTWATLNVRNGAEADERIGPAAVDRLKHGATVCFCDWPSYRERRVLPKPR